MKPEGCPRDIPDRQRCSRAEGSGAMSSLTRWVLSHKRTVVVFWIVMSLAGVAAGPGVARARRTSSPSPTRRARRPTPRSPSAIRHRRRHDAAAAGDHAARPARPSSPPASAPTSRRSTRRSSGRCPAPGSRPIASTGDRAFVSARRPHRLRARLPDRRRPRRLRRPTRSAEQAASAALRGVTVGGAPMHADGLRRARRGQRRQQRGPRPPRRGGRRRPRRAGRARCSCSPRSSRVVPLVMAVVSIMTTFLLLLGLTELTASRRSCSS